jgi:hypothetical protein
MGSESPSPARERRQRLAEEAFDKSADEESGSVEPQSRKASGPPPEHDDDVSSSSGIPDALKYFLLFHPMTGFFGYLAEKEFGHLQKPAFAAKKKAAPFLYWVCAVLDILWLVTAVLGVCIVAARVLYKGFFT